MRALLILVMCGGTSAASAQTSGVLTMPASTRAAGLGDAYVISAAESDAIFHQPGLLDAARGISFSRAWIGSAGAATALSGAGDWFRGGVGFGLQALSTGTSSEQVASLAYGRARFGLRIGVVAKVVDQRIGDERETYGAADIGIARAIGPVVLGLTGRNLGPDPSFDSGDGRLPSMLTLGAATRSRATGPLDVILAARTTWVRDGKFGYGGGIEAGYWPVTGRTFFARVGFSETDESGLEPLTLGGGFAGDRLTLDYAFQAGEADSGGDVHRVTLRWR
jgi:hypothetical protein